MALTVTVGCSLTAAENTIPSIPESVKRAIDAGVASLKLSDGTGDNAATKIWPWRQTLAASSVNFDLTALPLPNVAGLGTGSPLLALGKVKGYLIYNESTTDGAILYFGNAAANPWSAWGDTPAARIKVMPGPPLIHLNVLSQASNPWTVDATHKNVLIEAVGTTITFTIVFFGV